MFTVTESFKSNYHTRGQLRRLPQSFTRKREAAAKARRLNRETPREYVYWVTE